MWSEWLCGYCCDDGTTVNCKIERVMRQAPPCIDEHDAIGALKGVEVASAIRLQRRFA